MLQKPSACRGCVLEKIGTGFSNSEGRCSNGVLIIGEALGSTEVQDALPFRPYAEAGSVLQTAFRILRLERSDFGLWNMVACQPPYNALENTSYEYEAVEHCKVHFERVLKKFNPKVVLALGNVPLKHLWKQDPKVVEFVDNMPTDTKEEVKAKKQYLKNFAIGSARGYILESIYGIPLIASFHPSHINYDKGRTLLGVLMQDLMQAMNIAQNGIPHFFSNYNEHPTIEEAWAFYEKCKANPTKEISHDIETPFTALELDESEIEFENQDVRDIISIQFSIEIGEAIFFPWKEPFIEVVRAIMALPNPKIGWNNWGFDEINIEYHLGLDSIKGTIHDGMWLWKWLNQDFVKTGRALQFATPFASPEFPLWKHLSKIDETLYGCYDPDAALRCFTHTKKVLTTVGKLRNGRLLPTTKSLWEGYIDDVVKLRPILKDMQKRGFPVDIEEREKFRQLLEAEKEKVLAELQEMYPRELRKLFPKEGWKTIPNEVLEIEQLFRKASDINGSGDFFVLDSDDTYNLRLARYIEKHTRDPKKPKMSGMILREFDIEGFKIKRYCRMEDFKPGSSDQVIEYLKFKGYKVPQKKTKKGVRDTTSKEHLQPLWEETGDDLLYKAIYMRELDHMSDTYVGKSREEGWVLGSDDRVHATFTFIPATGQLSTIRPNIQNAPSHGTKFSSKGYKELAAQFRRTIAAKPGHTLVSSDWSAFHINTLAFEAEDPDYLRLAPIDPHSYLTAHMLASDLPTSLPKLKKSCPSYMTHDQWITEITMGEEALFRLQTVNSWLSLPDKELIPELKWIKKNYKLIRDAQAKRALLGMGFGMKVQRFFRENRFVFRTKAEPERIWRIIRKLFPKTFVEYHENIKNLADNQTYLITRYGYIRRFFNVYDWRLLKGPQSAKEGELIIKNSKGQWWKRRDGDSANEAVAYCPANDAFGKKKEAMRDFWEHPNGNLCKAFGLINEIHDDLMWEIEDSIVNEALPIIKEVMERPARYLKNSLVPDGLITKVEIKMGKNWADMEEVKI